MVRLRDQWVVVDPALVRKARKRELGLLDPVDALAVALTGSAEVDGERVDAVPAGALAALRPASSSTTRRSHRRPDSTRRCATTNCAVWPGWTG